MVGNIDANISLHDLIVAKHCKFKKSLFDGGFVYIINNNVGETKGYFS